MTLLGTYRLLPLLSSTWQDRHEVAGVDEVSAATDLRRGFPLSQTRPFLILCLNGLRGSNRTKPTRTWFSEVV
jgi:hypothetical protein